MNEDDLPAPETQPAGALVPPPRVPPTALALATPAPLPHRPRRLPSTRDLNTLRRFIGQTLDAVDEIADAIADGLGLRSL